MQSVDTDSDDAECVLARQSTKGAHPVHSVNILKAGSWTQGTRIFLEAKNMMIDFGKDVGQCVVGTDSSSIKSAVERHMLWLQERVYSGGICAKNWRGEYNIADRATKAASVEVLRTHLETVKWSGAADVTS